MNKYTVYAEVEIEVEANSEIEAHEKAYVDVTFGTNVTWCHIKGVQKDED